ncbi:MAG: DNA-processing protein DprA [Bacteroidales bacterium]|nr:DNA-processing protein DprA [Bacteroidales bacterium]
MTNKYLYAIALSMIEGIGSINAKKLIAYTGGIEEVFREKKKNLVKIPGISENIADKILRVETLSNAEKELLYIEKHGIRALLYLDDEYPLRLKQCADSPIIIYIKGNASLHQEKIISIVGTRSATDYGKTCCELIMQQLKDREHKVLIVSGLAYGIDIAAHKTALKHGFETAAVLGHGLNTIYPALHAQYAREIAHNGLLITEYHSQTKPDRALFIRRNRIIAGLSDATLVIESAEKGGALITAELANSYNREVFAIPGRITDNFSNGCNRLIAENKAHILNSVEDLENVLGWKKTDQPKYIQTQLFTDLSEEENVILSIIRNNEEVLIDVISLESGIPIHKVSAALLNLEFAGLVKSLPGKRYKAIG